MPQKGNFSRLAEMYSLENRCLFNTICPCQVFNPSVILYRSTPLQNWGETLSRPRATVAWPESFGSLDVAHCANVHTIGGKWAYSWEFYLFLPQAPTTRHIKLICFKCTASAFPPRIFCSLDSFVPSTCTANVIFRGQLGIYISVYIYTYRDCRRQNLCPLMWATFPWSNGVLDFRHCPLSRNQSVRAVHLADLWQNCIIKNQYTQI